MKNAILITGFSNWGKTHLLRALFERQNFGVSNVLQMPRNNQFYAVLGQSNDDDNLTNYLANLNGCIRLSRQEKTDLIAAFCPTRVGNDRIPGRDSAGKNDSRRIIRHLQSKQFEVHIILIKYKWELHAELRMSDIRKFFGSFKGIKFYQVIDKTEEDKVNTIASILHRI